MVEIIFRACQNDSVGTVQIIQLSEEKLKKPCFLSCESLLNINCVCRHQFLLDRNFSANDAVIMVIEACYLIPLYVGIWSEKTRSLFLFKITLISNHHLDSMTVLNFFHQMFSKKVFIKIHYFNQLIIRQHQLLI